MGRTCDPSSQDPVVVMKFEFSKVAEKTWSCFSLDTEKQYWTFLKLYWYVCHISYSFLSKLVLTNVADRDATCFASPNQISTPKMSRKGPSIKYVAICRRALWSEWYNRVQKIESPSKWAASWQKVSTIHC